MNKEHAELVERLRNYDECNDEDVDLAADAIERLSKDSERLADVLRQAILADDNLSGAARDDAMENFLNAARTALQLHKGE